MKLSDIILKATEKDVANGSADAIIDAAEAETKRKFRIKPALIIAAATLVLTISVTASANEILSGFSTNFNAPVDPGTVELVTTETDTETEKTSPLEGKVEWNITEVWFDEYNLHLGGTVTTPEPLPEEDDIRAECLFKEPDAEDYYSAGVQIFPNGTNTSTFVMSSFVDRDENGEFHRIGFEGDTITLELIFSNIHDSSKLPTDVWFNMEDYNIFQGKWSYTVNLTSKTNTIVSIEGEYKGKDLLGEEVIVNSLSINPFTLEITGENLIYDIDRELNPDYGHSELEYMIWLKTKGGKMIGKTNKLLSTDENRINYTDSTEEELVVCFDQPIVPENIESVLLVYDWATFPPGSEFFLEEEGYEYTELSDGSFEAWMVAIEIPIE